MEPDNSIFFSSDSEQQQQPMTLYETSRERELYDEQANLYEIIIAVEHLERAYARDAIDPKEYTNQCKKLISQFKLAERSVLGRGNQNNLTTTEAFMQLYHMDCPRAVERLLRMGVPESINNKSNDDSTNHAVSVAETVQMFITTMDAVKLDQRAVDDLQPLLSDLMDTLSRIPETPNDFEPKNKVQRWLIKLNAMRAVDEISDDDSRQLYHDLDSAYTEFTRYLKRGGL